MALLGEEVVEEWLNRQGYFTIRGIRIGVHEIDILAIKPGKDGRCECRHIEVQVSTNPIAYISKVPKRLQKERGIGPDNAKRREREELEEGVREWIAKKFDHRKKVDVRRRLVNAHWSRELVVNVVKHTEELEYFRKAGVQVLQFREIVNKMLEGKFLVQAAAGNDLLTLMLLGRMQSAASQSSVDGAATLALEGTTMDERVLRLKTPRECEQFACNVGDRLPDLAIAARRRAVELRAAEHGAKTKAEQEALQAVYAYERVLTEKRGKHVRASRTWQMIDRHGIIASVERAVNRPQETAGYRALVAMGMQDFAFEAVVCRHPEVFSEAAVRRSKARMQEWARG